MAAGPLMACPPTMGDTPTLGARLALHVDVRDAVTGRPLRAEIWLTTVVGEDSQDWLIERQTSLVEFELSAMKEFFKLEGIIRRPLEI